MKLTDILKMAIHNLWQRKLRGILNLVGIVIGCIILLMTAAGATGITQAVHALFNSSEFARQIEVLPGRPDPKTEIDSIVVEGVMTDERRGRLQKKIFEVQQHRDWRTNRVFIKPELVHEFEKLEHVVEVVPESSFECQASAGGTPFNVYASGISINNPGLEQRILEGQMLTDNDLESVLVHEYVAYRLGFRDDQQLKDLIGKKLTIEYNLSGHGLSMLYRFLNPDRNTSGSIDLAKQAEFLEAVQRMVGDLDLSSMTDDQKDMLKQMLKQPTDGEPQQITQTREFTVKGIFYEDPDDRLWTLFRRYILNRNFDIALHSKVTAPIYLVNSRESRFYAAQIKVDSVEHLEDIVPRIEEHGLQAISALPILKDVDREVGRLSWILYGLALAVLLIAAIGISNTMIISVLERTPEFGIMKAVGARDRHILWLMICESAILGAIGAAIALCIAKLIGFAGARILENYVEGRINDDVQSNLFIFSWQSVLIVTLVAVATCVFASLIPAYRAARLDPVLAMRRV